MLSLKGVKAGEQAGNWDLLEMQGNLYNEEVCGGWECVAC